MTALMILLFLGFFALLVGLVLFSDHIIRPQ